jgi:hypothetical protein
MYESLRRKLVSIDQHILEANGRWEEIVRLLEEINEN